MENVDKSENRFVVRLWNKQFGDEPYLDEIQFIEIPLSIP